MKTWSLKTETESEIVVYFSRLFRPEYFDCSIHVCSLAAGVGLSPESNRNVSGLDQQECPKAG